MKFGPESYSLILIDGQRDGQMDRRTDRQKDGQANKRMDRKKDRCTDGWQIYGYTDGQIPRKMYKLASRQTRGHTY
jgi:hypothetical protein